MRVTNIYAIDRNNIGDMSSSPLLYFSFPFPVECRSIYSPVSALGHIIFGGGGLLFFRQVEDLCRLATGKLVSWGIGYNAHGSREICWPSFMDRFALHGVRDWGTELNWVPCPSCMHPVFDLEHPIEHEVVVYAHLEHPIDVAGFPMINNSVSTMDEAVRFLGSGETILTSSYHGAYWGLLLGRRVLIVTPFSSKFYHFKHQPPITTAADWRLEARAAPVFPEALEECRKANLDHFARVCALF